jgi:hypothetical protein
MSFTRLALPAVAAAFLGLFAQPAIAQPAPAQPYCGAGYGNGIMGFLTAEQRMMHFAEMRKATAEMSFNDMRQYRLNLHNKVMAMSAAERKKFADDLSAKWDALSSDERGKIQQDFTAYRGTGRWGPGMGMGRGMGRGMGMGRGGCWW